MGSFSIWHWLVLFFIFISALWWWRINTNPSAAQDSLSSGLKPSGVGGWLSVYIVVSSIMAPILLISKTHLNISLSEIQGASFVYSPSWIDYKHFSYFFVACVIGWTWYLNYRLFFNRVPQTATLVKESLIAVPLIVPFVDLLASSSYLGQEARDASVAAELIKGILSNLAWLLYFIFSKRVRNTYYGGLSENLWSYSVRVKPVDTERQPQSSSDEGVEASVESRLSRAKNLRESGLITEDEYIQKKKEIIEKM